MEHPQGTPCLVGSPQVPHQTCIMDHQVSLEAHLSQANQEVRGPWQDPQVRCKMVFRVAHKEI